MPDVKLPGVGPVSRKWVVIVLGASGLTIGYIVLRRRSAASAAPAAAAADASASGIDPLTGDVAGSAQDQADLAAMQAGGGYADGAGADGIGDYGGYLAATPAAATIPGSGGFTTNGEWAQQAETDLGGIGVNPATLSAALGLYLTGRALTADQQSLVDQAIAEENYPPVAGPGGYPPAMRTGAGTTTAAKVTVPKLAGGRVEEATSALSSLGLKYTSTPALTSRKPNVPYHVTATSPAAGASVAAGSTVHLTIAQGA